MRRDRFVICVGVVFLFFLDFWEQNKDGEGREMAWAAAGNRGKKMGKKNNPCAYVYI